ncbi:MAG: betaine/proline/choline family ABC transporter ATP-binding protein [Pleomorphochaeta sp.]
MIQLKNIVKTYDGKTKVIDDLDLTINDGEFMVLVGESGCGKTTTMQMINRLVDPTSGEIYIDGEDITKVDKIQLRRRIGYVIQQIGLFPHWTIGQNVVAVLGLTSKDEEKNLKVARDLLDKVDLDPDIYLSRYPKELSGGQLQRVGVARALANDPDIILMDEPFSALDPITREQLQDEVVRIHDELGKTIIFVTHDIDEAIKVGDRIAVMQEGKIVQCDSAEEILKNPINDFVLNFVGKNRLWKTPDMLSAEDVMIKKFPTISKTRSVAQAIERMATKETTMLCVVEPMKKEKKKLLGLVGANRFVGISEHNTKMMDIMKTNFVSVSPETSLTDVINIRNEKGLKYIPVVDDEGCLCGIISNTSILNVLSQIMPGTEDY